MKIIRLNRRYIDQLAKIDSASGHEIGKARGTTLQDYKLELVERFAYRYELFFGYKEDSIIKGYATLKPFFPGYKHCELYWLAVNQKYQREGIGTKLLKFVEEYAKNKKFRKIFAYTNKSNITARKFYESNGYVFINEFPEYYGFAENNTAVLYGKKLL